MKISRFASCLLISTCLFAAPSFAQSDPAMERMDRLEHDIMLLQKQVANTPANSAASGEPISNAAQLEVRLSAIDDQIRELRGLVEQNQNEVRKVAENLDRFQKDTEFRLNQPGAAPAAAAPAPAAAAAPAPAPAGTTNTTKNLAAAVPAPAAEAAPAEGDKVEVKPADPAAKKPVLQLKTNFPTPRDHYNYAFRLLNQTQYEQAAASFDDFTNKYPKDALVGNAYYWGGETYYIRRDYVTAADYFRLGYEAMPEGPKAADNLYKLALSLNALDQGKEACVVLQQVVAKFKKTATNIATKAEQEMKNNNCRK